MIEINLRKSREVKVKATSGRKAHSRKIPSKESQTETEIWKDWQQHYKQDLYRPSAEPHEDMFSSVIMASQSPQKAILKLGELQKKYPSSVGADLAKEFKRLYFKTRDDVIPGRKSTMSGWIQTERQMIKMLEINLQKLLQKDERGLRPGQVRYKRGGKTFIREQRVGQKVAPNEGKGKLNQLPSTIKDTIIELRNLNYSGSQIKENIETILETTDQTTRQKLIDAKVITDVGSKLTVTPVAITQFAAKHGAKPTRTHGPKTTESVQAQEHKRHETTKQHLAEADKKGARLETELSELKDRMVANKKDAANKKLIREKLRSDLRACRAELGE